jgi:hypothetical protein
MFAHGLVLMSDQLISRYEQNTLKTKKDGDVDDVKDIDGETDCDNTSAIEQ